MMLRFSGAAAGAADKGEDVTGGDGADTVIAGAAGMAGCAGRAAAADRVKVESSAIPELCP
jgi:hypothetical protein